METGHFNGLILVRFYFADLREAASFRARSGPCAARRKAEASEMCAAELTFGPSPIAIATNASSLAADLLQIVVAVIS
jgi:hypothetical protein